jgi:tryptophan synthase alpha subunit
MVDGFIIPDLPEEELTLGKLQANGLDTIFLAAPSPLTNA